MATRILRNYPYDANGKDPIIAKVFDALRQKGVSFADAHHASGVSRSTYSNWAKDIDDGGTRCPQFATLQATALSAGYELRLMPASGVPAVARNGKGRKKRQSAAPRRAFHPAP